MPSRGSRENTLAHLLQVGAGSGGMPVLDMVCRDARITHVTLIEPDVYKDHNVERHLFAFRSGPKKGVAGPCLVAGARPTLSRHTRSDLCDPHFAGHGCRRGRRRYRRLCRRQ